MCRLISTRVALRAPPDRRERSTRVACVPACGQCVALVCEIGGLVDITQLILDDHHEQRRLFAIIEQINRSDVTALSAVWGRLGVFLELHAAAGEGLFFPALPRGGVARKRARGPAGE